MATVKKLAEELEEIRKQLNTMTENIGKVLTQQATLVTQQATLVGLVKEVQELKISINKRNKETDERFKLLEQRIDDLEQYSRADDLIITGLATKHRSYARVAAGRTDHLEDNAPLEELRTLEQQVVQFMNSKSIHLESQQISACHTLPSKDRNNPPTIVVKFANRKYKVEMLKQSKKLRDTGVYINEHLTKKNSEIARQCRNLRKASKVQSTWTRNGNVFIRQNGTPEQAKVVVIRHLRELDQYKNENE